MDFLLSTNFIKIEIIFLILSLVYIFFHICHSITGFYLRIKNIISPKKILSKTNDKEEFSKSPESNLDDSKTINNEDNLSLKKEKKKIKKDKSLTIKQKEAISEIIKIAKTKIVRGDFTDAKAKIIEGLSIDKFHKELNCLLASMYEKDKDYKKAEFIYKDLIIINDLDTEIYLKLGFVLSVQGKYEVAYEIYKKLYSIDENNIEAIEMLANIAHHLGLYEDSKKYAKLFLKNNPRNLDILYLQSINYINLNEKKEALEFLAKVKVIEPYNLKVNELISKLELELELADHFTVKNGNGK